MREGEGGRECVVHTPPSRGGRRSLARRGSCGGLLGPETSVPARTSKAHSVRAEWPATTAAAAAPAAGPSLPPLTVAGGALAGGRAGLGEGCGRAFRTRPNRPSRARVAWQNQGGRGGRGGERRERASAHEGCAQAGGGCGAGRAGGGASHLTRGPRVGTRSRTTPGGLRGAVPPLPCHGESNTRPLTTDWPPGGPSQRVHLVRQLHLHNDLLAPSQRSCWSDGVPDRHVERVAEPVRWDQRAWARGRWPPRNCDCWP